MLNTFLFLVEYMKITDAVTHPVQIIGTNTIYLYYYIFVNFLSHQPPKGMYIYKDKYNYYQRTLDIMVRNEIKMFNIEILINKVQVPSVAILYKINSINCVLCPMVYKLVYKKLKFILKHEFSYLQISSLHPKVLSS